MKRELKYGTLLLLLVFLNTISKGGYIHIVNYNADLPTTISQKAHDSEQSHKPYHLYAQSLKEVGTDKCSNDQKNRWYVRDIVDFSIMQILTKSYVATNTTVVSAMDAKSNDYYIFALRKIVV